MRNNTLSEVEQSLAKNTEKDSNSPNFSNSNLSNDFDKNTTNQSLNSSQGTMNLSSGINQTGNDQNNINTNQKQKEPGVFSRFFNYIKSYWTIEEEEYIDAHGFKAKRPKQKIPLRKTDDNYNSDIQKAGGESMAYATQHSGFGNLFL